MTEILKPEQATPFDLLAQAIDKGLGVEELGKLMDLQERWQANQAKRKFFEAFNEFQATAPEIRKTKKVAFKEVEYSFAPLSDIARQISKPLKGCGMSYRWEIQDDDKTIKVTCVISHVEGHTESTTMTANPDTTGSKNAIQARGSAIEYMKRYTLVGALGITTADSDIDGRMTEYEYDIDKLHNQFMETYNQVIQLDSSLSKWHPDNWVIDRTGKNYVKAIGDIRKALFELQTKKK